MKLKRKFSDNRWKTVCSIFHILAQIPFTTSKRELDFYHQKVNTQIASRVIKRLLRLHVTVTYKLFTWFGQNEMKANANKCHLLLSTTDAFNFEISETIICNPKSKKLLGITFNNKLKFEKHIITICQRANTKLNALARLTLYMEVGKRRIFLNAYFNSQFNYCPITWMCHSCALNNKINRLHERCLCIIYKDKTSTLKELLEKDNSVSIHYRNIQVHAIEIYKVANGMSPEIMN